MATASTSQVKVEAKPSAASLSFDLDDIDALLNQDAKLVDREKEVERVLRCFPLNPYEILDLDFKPGAITDNDIRKSYRTRSLLIHPDKLKHPRGIEAFDLLKKASVELEDPERRKYIDQTVADARMLVMRSFKLPDATLDGHPKLQNLKPPLRDRIVAQTREILQEDVGRKTRVKQMTMIAEGAENTRKEKELAEFKRKRDEKQQWEDSRENRVQDWRAFSSGANKKRKKSSYLG